MAKGIRYTEEEKQAIITEFHESGLAMAAFCGSPGKPSIQTLKGWMDKAGGGAVRNVINTPGKDSGLFADFTKSLLPDDVQTKYIAFLEKRVRELEGKLAEFE